MQPANGINQVSGQKAGIEDELGFQKATKSSWKTSRANNPLHTLENPSTVESPFSVKLDGATVKNSRIKLN